MKRRIFLKGSMAASVLGVAAGAGLLTPSAVLAAWPESAFKAKSIGDAMKALTGSDAMEESGDIKVKAPDIAENGAVVPISVTTSISGVESISIIASNNPSPLVASPMTMAPATIASMAKSAQLNLRLRRRKTSSQVGNASWLRPVASAHSMAKVAVSAPTTDSGVRPSIDASIKCCSSSALISAATRRLIPAARQ